MEVLFIFIAIHVLFSLVGFYNTSFFQRFIFRIDKILVHKQWSRIFTSGLLHVDGQHLFFNMFSLYLFGKVFLDFHPTSLFFLVYLVSLLSGNLFSLFVHAKHPYYQAAGASGGVSGLVFSTILLHPEMELAFIFLPFYFPGWVFGVGFLCYTFFGMIRGKDRIGHDAHLGGAFAGSLLIFLMFPQEVVRQPWILILVLGLPIVLFVAKR